MSDPEILAAEYALGLLEGEELLAARARIARDPAFAEAVARWDARLAPLLDEIGGVQPPADLWARIEARLADAHPTGEVVALRRSVRRWQWLTGISAAAAAMLAVFSVTFIAERQVDPAPDRSPLVASIPLSGTPLRLGLTYLPADGKLLVAADGLAADGVHDHQLWLISESGEPVSLGLVVPGKSTRVDLREDIADDLRHGSTIAISREPLGGSPDALPSGPVVASGTLADI